MRTRRGLALLALAVVGAVTLGGCTSPRNVLGSSASPCYRAVAVARLALHRQGRFSGVRMVAGRSMAPVLAGYEATASGPVLRARTALCLVAYRGTYVAAGLEALLRPGPARGHLAVVVVGQRDGRVVATLLLDHPPPPLARIFPIH